MSEAVQDYRLPPLCSGAVEGAGHMGEFEANFCTFLSRVHAE